MKISGLLITKNNEDSVGWALQSIRDYLDEIIVIDDFSTDETVNRVMAYGAKAIKHKFENFAEQRNFGIQQCSGDWIFTMDADEVMGENFSQAFKYLNTTKYRAFLFPRYNLVSLDPLVIIRSPHHYSEWQVRMFVNDGRCYYENPVHHQLQNCRPRLKIPHINIFHFHYLMHGYDERKKRVDYYESIEKGSGFPACYLFEDYPHYYSYGIEKIPARLLCQIKAEMKQISYEYSVSDEEQKQFERSAYGKRLLTQLRYKLGL